MGQSVMSGLEENTPGCAMGRRRAGGESVMLWDMF